MSDHLSMRIEVLYLGNQNWKNKKSSRRRKRYEYEKNINIIKRWNGRNDIKKSKRDNIQKSNKDHKI